VRSWVGLLGEYETARLRDQRRGKHVLEKGPTTRGKIGKGILLVLLAGSQDRENTFHKATAVLTLRTMTRLAPLHGMPQRALGNIVRLRDVGHPHGGPEGAFSYSTSPIPRKSDW
jgi:hypothetical protein